jgi:hypothetical protein
MPICWLTVATALAPLAADSPAFAAAPPAGKQAPGFYRYKVGDFEITVVTDGAATFPLPDQFVQSHPKAEVQKALAAFFQPTETVTIPFTHRGQYRLETRAHRHRLRSRYARQDQGQGRAPSVKSCRR